MEGNTDDYKKKLQMIFYLLNLKGNTARDIIQDPSLILSVIIAAIPVLGAALALSIIMLYLLNLLLYKILFLLCYTHNNNLCIHKL